MSLLMDALRKAEQQKQKQAAPGSADASQDGLALEPFAPAAPAGNIESVAFSTEPMVENHPPPSPNSLLGRTSSRSRLPELPTRLEDLDEQFLAHAAESPARRPQAAAPAPTPPAPAAPPPEPTPAPTAQEDKKKIEPSPESARKLLDAKHPAPKRNRKFVLAASLITLLAGIGIGGYVWWELQPKGMMGGNIAKAPIAPPPSAKPVEPVQASPAPVPAPVAPAVSSPPDPPPPQQTAAAAVPPASTSAIPADKPRTGGRPGELALDDEDDKPRPVTTKRTATPTATPPATTPATDSPVRVTAATRKQDPALELAYQAFNRGEVELAQVNWKKVLAKDSRNADALHGLATLALQNQKGDLAAEYYTRALENDPKDARALAGLLALRAPADTMQAESRLKMLLAEQPDSSYLNFALGNLFARDARWAEAQQAYFKAHTADPANPDYLFNLAVSLDQLHQPRLAAQYYGQALAAAAQQPAGFDAIQVATRLKALQSSLQQ